MIDIPPFEISGAIFLGIAVILFLGLVVTFIRHDKDYSIKEEKKRIAEDLLLLDPTIINLGLIFNYNYNTDKYDREVFSLTEMHRLANLQRKRNGHNQDYADLNNMQQRLKAARKDK